MKALLFKGVNDISLEKVKVPVINDSELLIKINYAGICGTDVRIFNGTKVIDSPRILGHEFSGIIKEVGTNIKKYNVGDRVTVYPMIACGNCYACNENRTNICINRKTIGYQINGGFAEYIKIPTEAINNGNVIKIPDSVTDIQAAASEPLAAAYNGIMRSNIKPNNTVVIIGGGPIGLLHVQLAKFVGAEKVILSEPIESKRKLAKKLGADFCINPVEENIKEKLMNITNGEGADRLLVDVGKPNLIENSLSYMKKGGRLVIFAGCPVGSEITIDPNIIHYKEIDFTGSSSSTPDNNRKVLELIAENHIDIDSIITDIYDMKNWKKGFIKKANYEGLKSLIKFNGSYDYE